MTKINPWMIIGVTIGISIAHYLVSGSVTVVEVLYALIGSTFAEIVWSSLFRKEDQDA